MKIYLAARYGRRAELAAHAEQLGAAGHEVTSRWLLGLHEASDGDQSRWPEFAQDDVDDILRCDTFITFTESQAFPRGSRHVEFGIALATGKRLAIIGPVENVFHALPGVLAYPNWQAFVQEAGI